MIISYNILKELFNYIDVTKSKENKKKKKRTELIKTQNNNLEFQSFDYIQSNLIYKGEKYPHMYVCMFIYSM